MTTIASRRRYLRLPVEGTSTWRPAGQNDLPTQESRVSNISLNGFCFFSEGDLLVETLLAVVLNFKEEQYPPLKGEAVVAWSIRDEEKRGSYLVGTQFSEVCPIELMTLLLKAYVDKQDLRTCLCAEVQFCSDAEKGRCPAYQQGRNCWELQELECCRAPRNECCTCPYAALAFLT